MPQLQHLWHQSRIRHLLLSLYLPLNREFFDQSWKIVVSPPDEFFRELLWAISIRQRKQEQGIHVAFNRRSQDWWCILD